MMTRATVEGQRVRVWQYHGWRGRSLWAWELENGSTYAGGHHTLGSAIADAQDILGTGVSIVRHTAAEPGGE